MTAAVSFNNVRKVFSSHGRETVALDDLTFDVAAGEYVCIVGRSGGGKSTTVNLTLGLIGPTSGTVRVLGVDPVADFETLRGRIACVFQADRLMPWRSAIDNVRLPLEIIGLDEGSLALDAHGWLKRLGLDGFDRAFPHELSGGMRQRVALARALVCDPEIILADESFASLDAITGDILRRDFHALVKSAGKTVIHITHSIDEAISLADRVVVVGKPGRVLGSFAVERGADGTALGATVLRDRIVSAMGETASQAFLSAAE